MCGLLRRHDFANFMIYCKHFTVLYLIAYNCLRVCICATRFFTATLNDDGPVIHEHGLSLDLNRNDQYRQEQSKNSTTFHFRGGGKAVIFSSDELHPYVAADLQENQYQFLRCVKKDEKQTLDLNGDILCCVPLNILIPKLTLKTVRELANLHDMYMPSKILAVNARILLENHKCETCPDLYALFQPYKIASNAECQQTWYKKNKDKCVEYHERRYPTSEYRENNKCLSRRQYWSKKNVKFPPDPPSSELCQRIVLDFCADTSPEIFEEAGCAVCGKLTPVCEMKELSEVENIGLLKVDAVTRKARRKSSDPVREFRGPILAPGCSRVCPICVESLDKNKMPILALANGVWIQEIPDELQNLTD
jgi:hypothetical protein